MELRVAMHHPQKEEEGAEEEEAEKQIVGLCLSPRTQFQSLKLTYHHLQNQNPQILKHLP